MRYVALVAAPLVLVLALLACEKNSEPDCRDDQCAATSNEGGGPLPESGIVTPTDDGATPEPFDSGAIDPTTTCKGLFELCAGSECCSPYGCTNGTCR